MTTTSRSANLRGWFVRGGAAVLLVAFCTSAIADPSKNVVKPKTKQAAVAAKSHAKCYIWVTGFGMPMPCDQMRGPIATTSRALVTIGNQGNTNAE